MFRFAAHTMATPEMTLPAAARLIADLNFEGIEIVYQHDYKCGLSGSSTLTELADLRRICDGEGIEVACLTPYSKDFGSPDLELRNQSAKDILSAIDAAVALGAGLIRILPGKPHYDSDLVNRMADCLREVAENAQGSGVALAVENHMDTAFERADQMASFISKVDHPAVGILYDPANLMVLGDTEPAASYLLQRDYIRHVHINDVTLPIQGQPITQRVLGEGDLNWREWMQLLSDDKYDGWVTLEYGTRWFAEFLLPPAKGLAHELACLSPYQN